jgi:endonuclease/exonuclease/phosphatase family metal-dependent hydrolase
VTVSSGDLRVATWNVWWRFGPDWRARQPAILNTLRAIDADLVALQETWGADDLHQPGDLAAQLRIHAAFAEPSLPPLPDPPEHADQIGYRLGVGLLSRWPIIRQRRVATPQRHRDLDPVALVATVAHPAAPLHIVIACLEWEPAYNDDRIAQARAVAELATDPALGGPAPVVLAGDMNAVIGSPALRPMQDLLIDTWTAAGGDPAAVSIPSSHPQAPIEAGEQIDQRVDHIFVRPGRHTQRVSVQSAAVVDGLVDGVHASDHKAVVVDLSWTDV